jgi:hypothetical protein
LALKPLGLHLGFGFVRSKLSLISESLPFGFSPRLGQSLFVRVGRPLRFMPSQVREVSSYGQARESPKAHPSASPVGIGGVPLGLQIAILASLCGFALVNYVRARRWVIRGLWLILSGASGFYGAYMLALLGP